MPGFFEAALGTAAAAGAAGGTGLAAAVPAGIAAGAAAPGLAAMAPIVGAATAVPLASGIASGIGGAGIGGIAAPAATGALGGLGGALSFNNIMKYGGLGLTAAGLMGGMMDNKKSNVPKKSIFDGKPTGPGPAKNVKNLKAPPPNYQHGKDPEHRYFTPLFAGGGIVSRPRMPIMLSNGTINYEDGGYVRPSEDYRPGLDPQHDWQFGNANSVTEPAPVAAPSITPNDYFRAITDATTRLNTGFSQPSSQTLSGLYNPVHVAGVGATIDNTQPYSPQNYEATMAYKRAVADWVSDRHGFADGGYVRPGEDYRPGLDPQHDWQFDNANFVAEPAPAATTSVTPNDYFRTLIDAVTRPNTGFNQPSFQTPSGLYNPAHVAGVEATIDNTQPYSPGNYGATMAYKLAATDWASDLYGYADGGPVGGGAKDYDTSRDDGMYYRGEETDPLEELELWDRMKEKVKSQPPETMDRADPDLQQFLERFGEDALSTLMMEVEMEQENFMDGSTPGMADQVPATIEGGQPAKLSDGEFVIPADVVADLGDGNSKAGAQVLEEMIARIRMKKNNGNPEQPQPITPDVIPPQAQ